MTDNLAWLADQPYAWVGKNTADGGYACIIHTDPLPWYKGGGFRHKYEGHGDTATEAVSHVRRIVQA